MHNKPSLGCNLRTERERVTSEMTDEGFLPNTIAEVSTAPEDAKAVGEKRKHEGGTEELEAEEEKRCGCRGSNDTGNAEPHLNAVDIRA